MGTGTHTPVSTPLPFRGGWLASGGEGLAFRGGWLASRGGVLTQCWCRGCAVKGEEEGGANGRPEAPSRGSILLAPWVAEPYRPWSLFEMKTLFAENVAKVASALEVLIRECTSDDNAAVVDEGRRTRLRSALAVIRSDCDALGLSSSLAQIDRMSNRLFLLADFPLSQARGLLVDLSRRFEDDLRTCLCFIVPRDLAKYWDERQPFGSEVIARFPSATIDIEEAGKCLACRRSTAAVFHLMRVMEVGLRVLGASLKDSRLDPKQNPSWDGILTRFSDEVGKRRKDRSPEWTADTTFFSGAAARLMAVKDAWRNPTMHVEIHYNDEQAVDVWNHVGAFMRHLASKLSE